MTVSFDEIPAGSIFIFAPTLIHPNEEFSDENDKEKLSADLWRYMDGKMHRKHGIQRITRGDIRVIWLELP